MCVCERERERERGVGGVFLVNRKERALRRIRKVLVEKHPQKAKKVLNWEKHLWGKSIIVAF